MSEEDEKKRTLAEGLRGATQLLVHATKQVTEIVEQMHHTIGGGPAVLGSPLAPLVKLFTAPVYAGIRGAADLVGAGVERALEELEPALGASGDEAMAVRAALNGVIGDHLEEAKNPLAIELELRLHGHRLPLEPEALAALKPAGGRLVVLLHGSSMDASSWARRGHDHGAGLEKDLGLVPIAVRYNSGLHVSTNGRRLAALLDQLIAAWPEPVTELVLLGFSMGGLVARSAMSVESTWRDKVSAMVFLGTPHHGAPLERVGNVVGVLFDVSRYSAPLGRLPRLRSAGVTDLRYGNVLDADWAGRDRFEHGEDPRPGCPLPVGVPCFAIAGTTQAGTSGPAPEDVGSLGDDGLVPVASALGRHELPGLRLEFPRAHQFVVHGAGHLDLLSSTEAYARIKDAVTSARASARGA